MSYRTQVCDFIVLATLGLFAAWSCNEEAPADSAAGTPDITGAVASGDRGFCPADSLLVPDGLSHSGHLSCGELAEAVEAGTERATIPDIQDCCQCRLCPAGYVPEERLKLPCREHVQLMAESQPGQCPHRDSGVLSMCCEVEEVDPMEACKGLPEGQGCLGDGTCDDYNAGGQCCLFDQCTPKIPDRVGMSITLPGGAPFTCGELANVMGSYLEPGSERCRAFQVKYSDICEGNTIIFGSTTVMKLADVWCGPGEEDGCPGDPGKTEPGECGCGVPEGTCENKTELPEDLSVTVDVDGTSYEIALHRYSVRAPGFQIFTYSKDRQPQLEELTPLPEPRTYRGEVVGNPYLLATGVVDEAGTLYLSAWNGRHRAWYADVSVEGEANVGATGYTPEPAEEIRARFDMPPVEEGKWFIPSPGPNFHTRLARVAASYEYEAFKEQGGYSVTNAIAQTEAIVNEYNYVFGQALGLRFDLVHTEIEVDGYRLHIQKPDIDKSYNLLLQHGSAGMCQASFYGAWISCHSGYRLKEIWPHEMGHILGLTHYDGMVDAQHHLMSVSRSLQDTQVALMQSRSMLEHLQRYSKYYQAAPFETPMLPAAFVDYITVYQNETGAVSPLENDYDANGDVLTIDVFDAVSREGGAVVRVGDQLSYTPPRDFLGPDVFTYTASDGTLKTEQVIHVLVVPRGLGGSWEIGESTDGIVDSGPLGRDLIVIDGEKADALVEGVDSLGLKALAKASLETVPDPFRDKVLPHVFDPGHKSFSASVWFKYSGIDDDLATILRDKDPLSRRVIAGKGTKGDEHVDAWDRPDLTSGGWEIRAEGYDLVMEVGVRDKFLSNTVFRIRDSGAIVEGKWHHAAIVIDRENGILRGYLDGLELLDVAQLPENGAPVIAAMTDSGYSNGATPLLVGDHTREPTGQSAWDNLKVYHRALSASEVRSMFEGRR